MVDTPVPAFLVDVKVRNRARAVRRMPSAVRPEDADCTHDFLAGGGELICPPCGGQKSIVAPTPKGKAEENP